MLPSTKIQNGGWIQDEKVRFKISNMLILQKKTFGAIFFWLKYNFCVTIF
jgi:hypothetical protein